MNSSIVTTTRTSPIGIGGTARRRAALPFLLALVASLTVGAAPASAVARDGICDDGEFCLYYNSNLTGSVFDVWDYDRDLRNNTFPRGNAKGQKVANNTASWWNRTGLPYHVYTGTNCSGSHGYMSTTKYGNFSTTYKNNVESVHISYRPC